MQKKIWIVLLIFFSGTLMKASAQQNHFIYIQTDDKQPFAVKLNSKLYNSSASGYVIIPKLIDGKYQATINFPGNKYPELQFFLLVDKKDIGYSLKNFDAKGWGLFNLQTFEISMNGQDIAGTDVATKQQDIATSGNQPSAFGNMLSMVTDDSTLTKTVSPAAVPEKTLTEQPNNILANDASKDTAVDIQELIAKNQAIVNNGIQDTGTIKNKQSFEIMEDSTQAIFIDKKLPGNDTAQAISPAGTNSETSLIPVPEIKKDTVLNDDVTAIKNNNDEVVKDTAVKKEIENPFYKKEEAVTDANANAGIKKNEPAVTENDATAIPGMQPAYKQDCRSMIVDGDIEKMKRKMVLQDNNDAMIQVAKKYLINKCITEQQVKKISGLFLSDEGRYLLFDALYGYVYDYGNYPLLEKQLVDEYYKSRFKAMLH